MQLLHSLTANNVSGAQRIEWNEKTVQAFERARQSITNTRSTVPFDANRQLFLLIDASDVGFGAVLAHLNQKRTAFEVIDIISGKWTNAQRKYTTPEKEITALRCATKRFHYIVYGRRTIVLCDNSAIVSILANGSTSEVPRIRKTTAEMDGLVLQVVHWPGSFNAAADALSRDPAFFDSVVADSDDNKAISVDDNCTIDPDSSDRDDDIGDTPLRIESYSINAIRIVASHPDQTDDESPAATTTRITSAPAASAKTGGIQALVQRQLSDPGLELLRAVANGATPKLHEELSARWREATSLAPKFDDDFHGALCVLVNGARRIVVPDGYREWMTRKLHGEAHLCAADTVALARRHYYWPTMHRDIVQYVLACAQCQRINASRHRAPGNLGDVERHSAPLRCAEWEVDSFDTGVTLNSQRVFVALERHSGCTFSIVLDSASAADALKAYIDVIERPHGQPRRIFCDNGTEFLGDFKAHLEGNGVQIITGLPDNHHHVARVERSNRDRLNRLTHMYLANGSVPPRDNVELQQWLDSPTPRTTRRRLCRVSRRTSCSPGVSACCRSPRSSRTICCWRSAPTSARPTLRRAARSPTRCASTAPLWRCSTRRARKLVSPSARRPRRHTAAATATRAASSSATSFWRVRQPRSATSPTRSTSASPSAACGASSRKFRTASRTSCAYSSR